MVAVVRGNFIPRTVPEARQDLGLPAPADRYLAAIAHFTDGSVTASADAAYMPRADPP
jgi:hypothetical protein